MTELTKQDIKEIFTEALEPFAQAVQQDFRRIDGRLDKIDERLINVESDVKWMKDNSSALFTKLDKFISLYEKQEQELLMLGAQLRRLEDRVAKLETAQ